MTLGLSKIDKKKTGIRHYFSLETFREIDGNTGTSPQKNDLTTLHTTLIKCDVNPPYGIDDLFPP